MKFQLLINTEIVQMNGNFRFRLTKPVIYPANKSFKMPTIINVKMPTIFNIYEQDKFESQLS